MAKDRKSKGKKEDERLNTSLRLRRKTLKALKLRAIEEDTSLQKIVERLVENYLESHEMPKTEHPKS